MVLEETGKSSDFREIVAIGIWFKIFIGNKDEKYGECTEGFGGWC